MQVQPVFQAGFKAHEQGFEAVELGVEALNDQPTAVEFGIQLRVVVGPPVGCASVARNVLFYVAPYAGLSQAAPKGFIGI